MKMYKFYLHNFDPHNAEAVLEKIPIANMQS